MEGGSRLIDWLKCSDSWRYLRDGGRESTFWLNAFVKTRYVMEDGSEFIG